MDRLARLEGRVKSYLAGTGLEPEHPEDGIFLFSFGTTAVACTLFTAGEHSYVRIAAVVLTEVEPSLELLQRLLRLNTEVLLGSFLLFEDATMAFSATLLGDDLGAESFHHTLNYVARVADEYDDLLQPLAGGRRARDLLDGT